MSEDLLFSKKTYKEQEKLLKEIGARKLFHKYLNELSWNDPNYQIIWEFVTTNFDQYIKENGSTDE